MTRPPVTVTVTDHAVERFGQRVAGVLDARPEIIRRVASAWMADRVRDGSARATVLVSDLRRSDVVYVCRWDQPRGELLVVTLWEEGEDAAVPRRFTDALRQLDRRSRPKSG
ncbi:MAG: hypothetical protein WKF94_17385 [Solirubrobacteraceae bacterium]